MSELNKDIDLERLFNDDEIAHWLAFDHAIDGIGLARVKLLFERFESLKAAWEAEPEDLQSVRLMSPDVLGKFLEARRKVEPEKLLHQLKRAGVGAIPFYHPDYPYLLRQINDPPMILYVKGHLRFDHWQAPLAVVGSRKPTSYGKGIARELARDLARQGVTVISGMAYGIDSLAHWGALDAGGKTVAVLGCGPDVCYPPTNRPLYERLIEAEQTAVISEFFPGTKPEAWQFPARNRIISGLSKGVIVVEADQESGALITANIAFEQFREVFSIPGRIDSRMSRGTNSLIRDTKAHLIRDYRDVMEDLNWAVSAAPANEIACVVELFGREKEILDLLSPEPIHFDHLCQKTGMAVGELSATLTVLELAGVITRQGGDWYSRSAP